MRAGAAPLAAVGRCGSTNVALRSPTAYSFAFCGVEVTALDGDVFGVALLALLEHEVAATANAATTIEANDRRAAAPSTAENYTGAASRTRDYEPVARSGNP